MSNYPKKTDYEKRCEQWLKKKNKPQSKNHPWKGRIFYWDKKQDK